MVKLCLLLLLPLFQLLLTTVLASQGNGGDGITDQDAREGRYDEERKPYAESGYGTPTSPKKRQLPEHVFRMLNDADRSTLTEHINQANSPSGQMVASTRLQSFLANDNQGLTGPTMWQSLLAAIGGFLYRPFEYVIHWIFYPRQPNHLQE